MQFALIPWTRDVTLFHEQQTLPYCYMSLILCLHVPWSRDFTPLWSCILFTYKMQFTIIPWARDINLFNEQETLPYCYLNNILPLSRDLSMICSIITFLYKRQFAYNHCARDSTILFSEQATLPPYSLIKRTSPRWGQMFSLHKKCSLSVLLKQVTLPISNIKRFYRTVIQAIYCASMFLDQDTLPCCGQLFSLHLKCSLP